MDDYDRLESCDVPDTEPPMTPTEAMESLVLHRDCLTALCERKLAATQTVRISPGRHSTAKVIRFPTHRTDHPHAPRDH
ncbi:hypothetical protein ABZ412_15980 [Nocardia sp. NPDC005746]|uniref:hypothetical protein n=1 Tax=Nocardia sp. NPDC005746 TaxID=3157062 RepID=UPI0033D16901